VGGRHFAAFIFFATGGSTAFKFVGIERGLAGLYLSYRRKPKQAQQKKKGGLHGVNILLLF
jgi:hypothetical protein